MSDPYFGGITLTSLILASLPATIAELSEKCDASPESVANIVYRLSYENVVAKTGKRETTKRGPKPAVWDRA